MSPFDSGLFTGSILRVVGSFHSLLKGGLHQENLNSLLGDPNSLLYFHLSGLLLLEKDAIRARVVQHVPCLEGRRHLIFKIGLARFNGGVGH